MDNFDQCSTDGDVYLMLPEIMRGGEGMAAILLVWIIGLLFTYGFIPTEKLWRYVSLHSYLVVIGMVILWPMVLGEVVREAMKEGKG